MRSTRPPILALSAFVVLAATSCPLRGQSKETLDTKVTAEGELIFLEWGKKHPWAAQLEAKGPTLLGEYRTKERPNQVSAECFSGNPQPAATRGRRSRGRYMPCSGIEGAPVGGSKSRTLRYRLPEALTATPRGPVCLFFRMPNGKILPIRAATRQGQDTARFRHSAWEQAAAKRTASATLARNVQQLREDVATSQENVAARKAVNEQKGWTTLERCQQYSEPTIEVESEDRPVAPPEKQDEVARLVCISRVYTGARTEKLKGPVTEESVKRPYNIYLGIVPPPQTLSALAARFDKNSPLSKLISEERRKQFQQFATDWRTFSGKVDSYEKSYPRPHFGAFRELLSLQTITEQAGESIYKAIRAGDTLDPQQVAGYIGGSLEAYTRCVEDGKAQLDSSYRRSLELRESTPELQRRIRQQLVTSCEAGIGKLSELEATHSALLQQLAREQEALRLASAGSAVPGGSKALNGAACSP